jgi:hypothetical protein
MKKILSIIIIGLTMALTACHQDNEDYYTLATIGLDTGDTLSVERVQAMAHITNLNSRHVVSTSDFIGSEVNIQLLRGAYQVNIEGIIRYSDKQGKSSTRSFRAVSDYVELVGLESSRTKLKIIFLD